MARRPTEEEAEAVLVARRKVYLAEQHLVVRRQQFERLLSGLRSAGVRVTELASLADLSREAAYEACRRAEPGAGMSPRRMRQFLRGNSHR
jgi:hypothetical protein